MMAPRPDGLILVLENSDEDFDTLLEALKQTGLGQEVRRAITGEGILKFLRGDDGEALRPCVILLDLNTPGLDGRDVLREIKGDDHLKNLPVVIFSTSANPRDQKLCYEQGANAYHVKPIQYPEHVSVLKEVLTYWLGNVDLPRGRELPV